MMSVKRSCRAGFTVVELLVVVAIFIAMFAVLAPFVRVTKNWAQGINCANSIMELSLGLHRYARDHGGSFPQTLSELYPAYVADPKAFDCPASPKRGNPADPDYLYVPGLKESSPGRDGIIEDLPGNHGRAGRNVLHVDGSVSWKKAK